MHVLMFIQCGRMKDRNVPAEPQRPGMDANFAVMDAASITKPAVMAVAVRKRGKILKNSLR